MLGSVLSEVYDIFKFQCDQKRIKLILTVPPALFEKEVIADKTRIKQILLNLLSNSFKFTFQGFISIEVYPVDEDKDKPLIKFVVKDSGVGIKKENIKKLFKLFGTITDSSSKNLNPHGCGIGLTVCKKYAEYMGGQIYLVSEYGKGTTVTFTIQFIEPEEIFDPVK